VHNLDDALPSVQRQEGLGTLRHALNLLSICKDLVQILSIGLA